MYFAGIGSRETPESIKPLIKSIMEIINNKGWILRSGGADGADSMFESFAKKKTIYLPWKGFNGNASLTYGYTKEAEDIARKFHPKYDKLSQGAKACISRNSYQVLGDDLKTPSKCIICYTPTGKATGGTGQAIRIAGAYNIPVFYLKDDETVQDVISFLNMS